MSASAPAASASSSASSSPMARLSSASASARAPVALAPGLADLFGQGIDLGPQRVAAAAGLAAQLVELGGPVDVGRVDAPPGQGGLHAVQVVAEAAHVDHGPDGSGPASHCPTGPMAVVARGLRAS